MLGRALNLLEAWRFPGRGEASCPGRDDGRASKPYKISSFHAMFTPAANAPMQASASISNAGIGSSPDRLHVDVVPSVCG
jgi:hypothetical protein